jgi:hypothetical protein
MRAPTGLAEHSSNSVLTEVVFFARVESLKKCPAAAPKPASLELHLVVCDQSRTSSKSCPRRPARIILRDHRADLERSRFEIHLSIPLPAQAPSGLLPSTAAS